jgi:hypothetical protein
MLKHVFLSAQSIKALRQLTPSGLTHPPAAGVDRYAGASKRLQAKRSWFIETLN